MAKESQVKSEKIRVFNFKPILSSENLSVTLETKSLCPLMFRVATGPKKSWKTLGFDNYFEKS